MSKTCNGCDDMSKIIMTSGDWQKHEQRHADREKRYIGVIVLLIVLLVATNAGWLIYESQFETVETVEEVIIEAQQGDGVNIVGGGDVNYGAESNNQEENHNQNPN